MFQGDETKYVDDEIVEGREKKELW